MAQFPTALAAPIRLIAKQALGKEWQLYGILLDHWPAIIGDAWAEMVHPVKLSFPPAGQAGQRHALRSGALTLRLPRGLALEVQYQQPQIITRINNFFGADAITKLVMTHRFESPKLRPTPRPLKATDATALHTATDAIDDAELRAALEGLGAQLYTQPR